ncbi:MAG TPA: MBL fold metallo-hydrolase [Actinomycetes bacterium]|nr:MBL fold metallo-hydrolase [Actinomycetes bacterium]
MLVVGFPAQAFDTNCYVVAPAPGEECLVVDPGIGVEDHLEEVLREHRLRPVAVLLTHGHLDHVFSVTPVCGARGVPAYIHSDDRSRLTDPTATFGPVLSQMFGGALEWSEPDDVLELSDGMRLQLAGLDLVVDHAPGHTEGSVLFRSDPAVPSGDEPPYCLSGDVLFAGSIGRTDLPGGDSAAMVRSLRERILPLADETVVLPGHGPRTTIGRERVSNPFLVELGTTPPTRGV